MAAAAGLDYESVDVLYTIGLGRRVAGQLAEHDKTQEDAARVLGLSQAAVNRRIKGHVPFTSPELGRLALWLRVPYSELLPRLDSNQQPAGFRSPGYRRTTRNRAA